MMTFTIAGAILLAAIGLFWLRFRIRARRRQAALDAYADREEARSMAFHKH
jgi:hypothetical protein